MMPKILYVREEEDIDGYYVASPLLQDALDGDDLQIIGTYWLKERPRKYRKVVSAEDQE